MMTDTPMVLVVDDDEGMRTSVAYLLASVGIPCETFASAEDFLRSSWLQPPLRPGCILMDIRMPGMSGIELLRHLKQEGCKRPVVIVTGHGDVPLAVAALKAGAEDFIEKPYKDQALLDAVNAAIRKCRLILERSAGHEVVQARLAQLSRREREVLTLVLDGKQNKEIAAALNISIKTVEGHRQMAMEKMRAKSVAELARMMLAPDGVTLA
ncbi:response regulator transcription factor [Azospirillum sp. ST 5-10]|uniref:response regulator transcription factor n=1 Tax=unclassified Azospirillum TaxID=2630922 RepID=UPI003F49C682